MQPAGPSTREKDEQTMAAEQMALSGERKICQNQVFHRLGFFFPLEFLCGSSPETQIEAQLPMSHLKKRDFFIHKRFHEQLLRASRIYHILCPLVRLFPGTGT